MDAPFNIRKQIRIPEYDSVNVLNSVIMPNHVHFLLEVRKGGEGDANRSKMLVPKIVQSFKAAVTRKAASKYGVIWQSRYYDHVVRDEQDLLRIWQYIDNNPARWLEDCYYTAYADR